jgi:hypothetical protein
MKDLFTGEIKFIDENDIPGDLELASIGLKNCLK